MVRQGSHTPDRPATVGRRDGKQLRIDETSFAKKGDKTPGVQRQYCGTTGKIDNCIVTVHPGVGHGSFSTILDGDPYLPRGWADDRDRCRKAGVPDDPPFRTKTRIALDQVKRAVGNGGRFDWIGFDEGYGKPPFLPGLEERGVTFIGEVAANFRCFSAPSRYQSLQRPHVAKEVRHLARGGKSFKGRGWKTYRVRHKTVPDSIWTARAGRVYISVEGACHDQAHWLIVAKNKATGEIKYFISNAPPRTGLGRMLSAAFSRWGIEHLFRVAKSGIGLGRHEGRKYLGLMRHMALCRLTLLFIAEHTERLGGGENPQLTKEQVARAVNAICARWLRCKRAADFLARTAGVIKYHQTRNATAMRSRGKFSCEVAL